MLKLGQSATLTLLTALLAFGACQREPQGVSADAGSGSVYPQPAFPEVSEITPATSPATGDAGVNPETADREMTPASSYADAGTNQGAGGTTGIASGKGTGTGTKSRIQSPNAGLTGSGPRGETGSRTGPTPDSKPAP